jgi:D-alanyl-D-alanine dipeptidase
MRRGGAIPPVARICHRAGQACALVALLALPAGGQAAAQGVMPAGFVHLREVDPTIAQDIRYAGADNFVGRPLPGYGAAECVLRRDAAAALSRVQAEAAALHLRLKVYDCYRPHRAVRAMAQWAHDGQTGAATRRFFPRLQKNELFALGYIAARSAHSTGTAVDLTLVEAGAAPAAPFAANATYGPCTAPPGQRAPDDSVDMGTGYDCFDTLSHTANAAVGAESKRWRRLLVTLMARHGFRNYYREWWHFVYAAGAPAQFHDFPIVQEADGTTRR